MIIVKLGGSIITNKEKPLSARRKTIDKISKNLKKINEPMVIVHGGGSYGHYWSVKYDMHPTSLYIPPPLCLHWFPINVQLRKTALVAKSLATPPPLASA